MALGRWAWGTNWRVSGSASNADGSGRCLVRELMHGHVGTRKGFGFGWLSEGKAVRTPLADRFKQEPAAAGANWGMKQDDDGH